MYSNLMESYKLFEGQTTYYGVAIKPDDLFGTFGVNNCKCFVEENFTKGGKERAFDFPESFKESYNGKGKHLHTISLFMLGLSMEPFFKNHIQKAIEAFGISNLDSWYTAREFGYTWLLLCLYHDVATSVEDDTDCYKSCCDYCPNNLDFMDGVLREFDDTKYRHRFDKETVKNYCRYRKESGKNDHGILAGQMLYRGLISSFKEATKRHNWSDISQYTVKKKIGNETIELQWYREFMFLYAYVAEAIICHNMWTVSENDRKNAGKYRLYGLDELIIKNDSQKLTFDKHPLQFMLCLLDSIEPVKRFVSEEEPDSSKVRTVLENVSIQQKDNEIEISWAKELKTMNGYWDWMKNIYELSSWMNVTVTPCQCDHYNQECNMKIIIHRRQS